MSGETLVTNALTIDLEDWYHATYLGVPESTWPGCERWLAESTGRLLDMLSEAGVRATFFVLGCVAYEAPDLIRTIADRKHEIACHSFSHKQVFRQTPAEFEADVKLSVKVIEEASGRRVLGYRAPACSIGKAQHWAFEILADQGFLYDSSIMPVRTPLYGDGEAPRFIHQIADGRLAEIPLATVEIGRWRFPMAGGVYLRMLPFNLICRAIQRLNKVEGQPAVIYLHPWEVDPRPPRSGSNRLSRWSHTVNKRWMEERVRQLLRLFSFAPIQKVFELDGEARFEVTNEAQLAPGVL